MVMVGMRASHKKYDDEGFHTSGTGKEARSTQRTWGGRMGPSQPRKVEESLFRGGRPSARRGGLCFQSNNYNQRSKFEHQNARVMEGEAMPERHPKKRAGTFRLICAYGRQGMLAGGARPCGPKGGGEKK